MVGAIMGGASLVGGQITGSQQYHRERDIMGLQYDYNQKMAEANNQRSKELWDYTNYENQRAHMEKAGLNPALMYGMNGGGGSSTGNGGGGNGVSQAGTQSGAVGNQMMGIGLQAAMMESQVELNKANAAKANAEATKTGGVDTKAQEANIANIIAQTTNEGEKQKLIKAETKLTDANEEVAQATEDSIRWNLAKVGKEIKLMNENINGVKLDNELKQRTMENNVEQAGMNIAESVARIYNLNSTARAKLTEVVQGWTKLGLEKSAQGLTKENILKDILGIEVTDENLDKTRWKDVAVSIANWLADVGQSIMIYRGLKGTPMKPFKGFGK